MILVPVALAISGRYRPFLSWAVVCSVLGVLCLLALGPSGVNNWWHTLEYGQTDTGQAHYTLAYVVGTDSRVTPWRDSRESQPWSSHGAGERT